MSELSSPWDNTSPGDAGAYSATEWQAFQKRVFGTGANKANRGVIRNVDDDLAVEPTSPASTSVTVGSGSAILQGIWYYNDADVSVSVAANSSGSTRIDVIVLEADYVAQTVRVAIEQGTPGAGIPSLTQTVGTLYQIPLAYLTLANGFSSIAAADITDMREYINIPSAVGIDVTNDSAIVLENGATVIWDSSGGVDVNTTTTPGNRAIAGVVERRIAVGGTGRIIVHGIMSVICDESVAIGDFLELSSTAGQAQKIASVFIGAFARVLVANSGAGTRCLAYINVPAYLEAVYDSGWFACTSNTTYTLAHGLGAAPRQVDLYHSTAAAPGAGDELVRVTVLGTVAEGQDLDCIGIDATNLYISTGNGSGRDTVRSTRRQSSSGYYRAIARL